MPPWRAISSGNFPYSLRQLPGPDNALGTAKLEVPNRFDVFLHDTPARSLFTHSARYFSHGCIRVEKIMPLASTIAAHDDATAGVDLAAAVAGTEMQEFKLSHPIAIYVLYQTAIPRDGGSIDFRADIYGRDERLIAALAGHKTILGAALPKETECTPTNV